MFNQLHGTIHYVSNYSPVFEEIEQEETEAITLGYLCSLLFIFLQWL